MIVDRLRRCDTDGCSGVECEVRFETGHRNSQRIFVSTDSPCTVELDPNGFLIGTFLPAWTAGEQRIRIDGAVCPLLAANLSVAASMLRTWFADLPAPPAIEADYEYRQTAGRSGAFLSGGVDSLAMLRSLITRMPPGHADRPSAAIVVDCQHVGAISREESAARFARSVATSREICADLGLDVIPIRSNFCSLNDGMAFWMYRYHGALLASMAHFLSRDFRRFYIASTYPATHLVPWGTHPQLDPLHSSQHVRIVHEGIELSRLQKVKALQRWPAALDCMYVCTSSTSAGANCGVCEKCIRTRLHLLLAGALGEAGAFSGDDLSASEVRNVRLKSEYARVCFEEALPELRELGRNDLVAAVEDLLKDYARSRDARPASLSLIRRAVRKLQRSLEH